MALTLERVPVSETLREEALSQWNDSESLLLAELDWGFISNTLLNRFQSLEQGFLGVTDGAALRKFTPQNLQSRYTEMVAEACDDKETVDVQRAASMVAAAFKAKRVSYLEGVVAKVEQEAAELQKELNRLFRGSYDSTVVRYSEFILQGKRPRGQLPQVLQTLSGTAALKETRILEGVLPDAFECEFDEEDQDSQSNLEEEGKDDLTSLAESLDSDRPKERAASTDDLDESSQAAASTTTSADGSGDAVAPEKSDTKTKRKQAEEAPAPSDVPEKRTRRRVSTDEEAVVQPVRSVSVVNVDAASIAALMANEDGLIPLDADKARVLFQVVSKHRFAEVFKDPVTDDDAPGYSDIIRDPMDLSTIQRRLHQQEYQNLAEYFRDYLLMFQNAFVFNDASDDVHYMAEQMLQFTKQSFVEYVKGTLKPPGIVAGTRRTQR